MARSSKKKELLEKIARRSYEDSKVLDWDETARIINREHPECVVAGLKEDWQFTAGIIYQDGKPCIDEYTYLASSWATPALLFNGKTVDCFVMKKDSEWDAKTKWPSTALEILNGKD